MTPRESSSRAIPLLYALFFLSGAAGLFYESVWSRYLGLFVGHSAYAQVVVLAIFLGGMSVGATLVARKAERIARPLFWYALIEIAVGVIGLFFHDIFVGTTEFAYVSILPALSGGALRTVAVWGIAALLILPQSILLGTTFPLMSAAVLRLAPREPGRVLGWLYFTNSLGAAIGVLVAGFVLVAMLGLPGVLLAAAGLNFVVGLVAVLLTRQAPASIAVADTMPAPPAMRALDRDARLLLWVAALTAVASFCYEINWIRMLSLVLGSATHAFELMLSAFILGLALGAFWIRQRTDQTQDMLLQLAKIQIAMGVLAVVTLPLYAASFQGMELLLTTVNRTANGYTLFSLARYALCLVVMLPATFCAGMTLPLITRALLARGHGEGAIGRVYAVNTLGAIVGVLLASLVLLPLLGLKATAVLAGGMDILLGVALLWASNARRHTLRVGVAAIGTILTIGFVTHFDRSVLTSGVYRGGRAIAASTAAELLYYADGRTATVAVSEGGNGFRALSTNGKTDASIDIFARLACSDTTVRRQIGGDQVTQLLLAMIPLAYHPNVRRAAVIGMGSGVTSHVLLSSPTLREVVTVEIEPKMVEAARLFGPANDRTYTDPRSRIVIDDAKAYFAASGTQWDMIVSEPSNPWVSGVSSLFTVEFYRRIKTQLAPGAIFAQWLQTYDLDDGLVLSVLAAVHEVFPDYRIHQVGSGDLLLIASADGAVPEPDWERVLGLPDFERDLCHYLPITRGALEATILANRKLVGPALLADGVANSDFYPVLDLRAEQQRFEQLSATGMLALGDDWFNAARALAGQREAPRVTEQVSIGGMRTEIARWVRTWHTHGGPPPADLPAHVVQGRFDNLRWDALLALDTPPEDWRPWLGQLNVVMKARHAGTAGWLDSTLVDGAAAFAQRHHAPEAVAAAIAFRRAVLVWDDAAVIQAATALMLPDVKTLDWVNGDELRDGVLTAAVRLGDPALVRGWEGRTAKLAQRSPGDMRSRLLAGWVQHTLGKP